MKNVYNHFQLFFIILCLLKLSKTEKKLFKITISYKKYLQKKAKFDLSYP